MGVSFLIFLLVARHVVSYSNIFFLSFPPYVTSVIKIYMIFAFALSTLFKYKLVLENVTHTSFRAEIFS